MPVFASMAATSPWPSRATSSAVETVRPAGTVPVPAMRTGTSIMSGALPAVPELLDRLDAFQDARVAAGFVEQELGNHPQHDLEQTERIGRHRDGHVGVGGRLLGASLMAVRVRDPDVDQGTEAAEA